MTMMPSMRTPPHQREHLVKRAGKPKTNTMSMTRNLKSVALAVAGVLLITGCAATGNQKTKQQQADAKAKQAEANPIAGYQVHSTQRGIASWYSIKTNYGTQTASGQRLRNDAATAAHKTLPLGTKVRVTNMRNGKSEVLTINDRGPYIKGRIIDVTIGCAERLGFVGRGIAPVKVEVLRRIKTEEKAN